MTKKYIPAYMYYAGNKSKLLKQIIPKLPTDVDEVIELFAGTGVISSNLKVNNIKLNDSSYELMMLNNFIINGAYVDDIVEVLNMLNGLYGLDKNNPEGFYKLRKDFNLDGSPIKLLLLINNSINCLFRFNSKGEFNASYGHNKQKLTDKRCDRLVAFANSFNDRKVEMFTKDFRDFKFDEDGTNKLVYIDPPYLISSAQYNSNWKIKEEIALYDLIDDLNSKNYKIAMSNVTVNKNETNAHLIAWMAKYNIYNLDISYNNSWNNCRGVVDESFETKEVLITNYDASDYNDE